MKRLFVLVLLFAIALLGTAYAADQPVDNAGGSPAAVTQSTTPDAALDSEEAVDTEDQATTEEDNAQKKGKKPRTSYGVMLGVYNPVNSQVQDLFGDSWFRYGLRPITAEGPQGWRSTFDVSFYSMSKNFNDVQIIPVTLGMIRRFGDEAKARGYVAVNVGPYYCDVTVPGMGIDKKGVGMNANVTAGVIIKKSLSLEARYEVMNDFEGLDFSALTFSAVIKAFTAKF